MQTMSDLDEVLTLVRNRLTRYRDQSLNEQNTKSSLIDPVLRALGWDTEDFEEVHREYKPKPTDNPVDYALFILRTPRLFLEAKALGGNLNDRRWANQIMGYAAVSGVEWVVLTDGNEYRLYNAHAPVPIEEKLFRSVQIDDDGPPTTTTLELLSKERMQENLIEVLWRSSFIDQQILVVLESLFGSDPDPAFVRFVRNRLTKLAPSEIKEALVRLHAHFDFPVASSTLASQSTTAGPPPIQPLSGTGAGFGQGTPWRNVTIQDLITSDLLKVPLEIRKTYKGHEFVGRITGEGKASWGGREYDSLSTAAGFARASIIGSRPGRKFPQTNGWTFWEFVDVDGQVKPLDELRQRFYAAGANPHQ
jgi:hypothetical protein